MKNNSPRTKPHSNSIPDPARRLTIGLVTSASVGSAATIAAFQSIRAEWLKPIVKSVVLSAHAQISVVQAQPPPPAITGEIRVTSILWRQTASNDPNELVDEYVDIQNVDSVAIDIENWTLSDEAGATLTFPQRVLQPGDSCRIYVHTPPGNQACEFTFGRTRPDLSFSYIFNNTGDTAFLADGSGAAIDSCNYAGGDSSPFSCP